jgi:hypothetical protein
MQSRPPGWYPDPQGPRLGAGGAVIKIVGAAVLSVFPVAIMAGCSHRGPTLAEQCNAILATPSAYSTQQVVICQQWWASVQQSCGPEGIKPDLSCND